MALNKHIQLFRNLTPSNTRAKLLTKLDSLQLIRQLEDSVPVLGRYKEVQVKTHSALHYRWSSYTLQQTVLQVSVTDLALNELRG